MACIKLRNPIGKGIKPNYLQGETTTAHPFNRHVRSPISDQSLMQVAAPGSSVCRLIARCRSLQLRSNCQLSSNEAHFICACRPLHGDESFPTFDLNNKEHHYVGGLPNFTQCENMSRGLTQPPALENTRPTTGLMSSLSHFLSGLENTPKLFASHSDGIPKQEVSCEQNASNPRRGQWEKR